MTERNDMLTEHLKNFAQLNDKDIHDSQPFWKARKMKKGDFFNMQQMVCNDLGLIARGIFRIYFRNPDTKKDQNIYFFSENQFVVSFRSFLSHNPCWYFIEAMEDSEIFFISYKDLNGLYQAHPNWAKFGRLLAESFFTIAQTRTEDSSFSRLNNAIPDCWRRIRLLLSVSRLIISRLTLASPTRH